MLNLCDIERILSNWEIDRNVDINPIPKKTSKEEVYNAWFIGRNYVLKTGKNFIELKTHLAISKALENQGLNATTPVMTKSKDDFVLVNDSFFVLMNKVEGETLKQSDRFAKNRINVGIMYGEAIGSLHQSLLKIDNKTNLIEKNILKTVKEWALPETKRLFEQWRCQLPKEYYEYYLENCDDIFKDLPKQIIHRDPHADNILFHKGDVSGFIDFEISEKNIRIFDPCYLATSVLVEAGDVEDGYDIWPEILYGVIKGYDEISNLSEEEIKAIPYVMYSIIMIFIAWLNDKVEYKDLAKANREIIVWLWANHEMVFDILCMIESE